MVLHLQIEESLQFINHQAISKGKIVKLPNSQSLPSSPLAQTEGKVLVSSPTCKQPRRKKHYHSSTVPVTLLQTCTGLQSKENTCNEEKCIGSKVKPKHSNSADKNLPASYSEYKMKNAQKSFKEMNEFERLKRVKVMAEKISRVSIVQCGSIVQL